MNPRETGSIPRPPAAATAQHQLQVLRDEHQGPELDEEVEDIGGQGPR